MEPIIVSNLPVSIVVFKLADFSMYPLEEFRIESDPRYDIEVGDTWTRVGDNGESSRHRVWDFSKRQNHAVTEEHATLIPVGRFGYH